MKLKSSKNNTFEFCEIYQVYLSARIILTGLSPLWSFRFMMINWRTNCFCGMVEQQATVFPEGTIVKKPNHCDFPTRQGRNWSRVTETAIGSATINQLVYFKLSCWFSSINQKIWQTSEVNKIPWSYSCHLPFLPLPGQSSTLCKTSVWMNYQAN